MGRSPWIDSFSPRLTSVNIPKYELGRAGAGMLLDRVAPSEGVAVPRGVRQTVFKTTLCLRESCGYELRRKQK
jgi:DNA-binding LacI/PurR family transcriptional regulator